MILEDVDMTYDNVIKVTFFIVDMTKNSIVSSLRDEYFKNSRPVSVMIGVTGLVRPECLIEIELIAAKNN